MFNFLSINTTSSVLLILISFFCVFLFVENHKLREKLKKTELENKRLLEIKVTKQKNDDSIPINKISNNEKKQQSTNNQLKKIELVQKYQPKENKPISNNQDNSKLYQKNVLHDKPSITSPISINKKEDEKFNLNDFIKTNDLKVENSNEVKEEIKITNNKKSNNIEYLQGISNKMADELKPQTIELTDYEKNQEENAVISYKELLAIKDKIMMLDDEDENINFIEELKNLRNSLK